VYLYIKELKTFLNRNPFCTVCVKLVVLFASGSVSPVLMLQEGKRVILVFSVQGSGHFQGYAHLSEWR
jgi:hypothetical protein